MPLGYVGNTENQLPILLGRKDAIAEKEPDRTFTRTTTTNVSEPERVVKRYFQSRALAAGRFMQHFSRHVRKRTNLALFGMMNKILPCTLRRSVKSTRDLTDLHSEHSNLLAMACNLKVMASTLVAMDLQELDDKSNLFSACAAGDPVNTERLLKSIDINSKDYGGRTPLHLACGCRSAGGVAKVFKHIYIYIRYIYHMFKLRHLE